MKERARVRSDGWLAALVVGVVVGYCCARAGIDGWALAGFVLIGLFVWDGLRKKA